MPHEIEVKLELRNPRALKRRLVELGFEAIRARSFESNRLYDFVDGRLRKAGWVLGVRFVGGCCSLLKQGGRPASKLRSRVRQA